MKKRCGQQVIALAGNPNVGKSTVFNALTGMRQHTGNWPGKTVELAWGMCELGEKQYQVVDLPGTYSLNAHSQEEEVASEYLCQEEPDLVVVICDATCLERNLILALQIMGQCTNVMLCVNLLDEAKRKHITIDLKQLEEKMGIPVAGIVAHRKKTVEKLKIKMGQVLNGTLQCHAQIISRDDLQAAQMEEESVLSKKYVSMAAEICVDAVGMSGDENGGLDRKIDQIVTSPLTGYPVMILLLFVIFWITISGANVPSNWLSQGFAKMECILKNAAIACHVPQVLFSLFFDGIYRVITWVVSVMLPPMAIFFPLFTLLEDAGYLPRVAYNLDKPFAKCNACGKQALTMCMGFGCNAVGVTGCRIIDTPRERLLAVLTNCFVPCNGRFPTIILMITLFFVANTTGGILPAVLLTVCILFGIAVTFLVTGLLSKTLLKGMASSFTLELPSYRKPQYGKVIVRSVFDRTLFVLARAAMVAAPAGIIIWTFANVKVGNSSLLQYLADVLNPVGTFIGLDGAILLAFILGFPANEIVIPLVIMIYMGQGSLQEINNLSQIKELFVSHGWTGLTAVCVILFSLCHWPCSTTLLTVKKETGSIKWTVLAALIPTIVGFLLCSIVSHSYTFFFTYCSR